MTSYQSSTVKQQKLIHDENHRMIHDIKEGAKDLKHGVQDGMHGIKLGVRDAVNYCMKPHKHDSSCSSMDAYEAEMTENHAGILTAADEHERRAQRLRETGEAALKQNEREFEQAYSAQAAARIASDQANLKTEKALHHQERGQQLLAEAGKFLFGILSSPDIGNPGIGSI